MARCFSSSVNSRCATRHSISAFGSSSLNTSQRACPDRIILWLSIMIRSVYPLSRIDWRNGLIVSFVMVRGFFGFGFRSDIFRSSVFHVPSSNLVVCFIVIIPQYFVFIFFPLFIVESVYFFHYFVVNCSPVYLCKFT